MQEWTGGILPFRSDGGGVLYLVSGAYMANEQKIRFTGRWGSTANSPDADRAAGLADFASFRQQQYLGSSGVYLEAR